ncbi:MAG TPA: alpha/beta hydrolase fold domain-containing protein, partial [Myxococcota bacterium]
MSDATTTDASPSSAPFADDGVARFVQQSSFGGALDIADMRKGIAERAQRRAPGPVLADVRDVNDVGTPGVRARLYRATLHDHAPALLWLHGGGFSTGSIASHDRMARRLASASGVAVVLLEYRLAPEHRYPASIDDTVAALRFLRGPLAPSALGFTPAGIAVGGDSAG